MTAQDKASPIGTVRAPLTVLTTTALKTDRRCAREYHIAYELGYRPAREPEALRFGALLHRALEAWWKADAVGDRLASALAILDTAAIEGSDLFEVAKARELMIGYEARWSNEPLEALVVEKVFEAPLTNPETGWASKTYTLSGKVDAIVRDTRDGQDYLLDHKTSSEDVSSGSDYWKRTRMDSQVSMYYLGAKALGFSAAGWIHDVIHKPALRPLKATPLESRKYTKDGRLYAGQRERDETPGEYGVRIAADMSAKPDVYFQRGTVVRLEAELREAALDVWQQAAAMRDRRRLGIAPRNVDACQRYGGLCPFWSVCSGEASLDDPEQYRRVALTHEELHEQRRKRRQ